MRKILFLLISAISCAGFSQVNYNEYFTSKRYRFDYFISGTQKTAVIVTDKIHEEPIWGGQQKNLIDTFEYGDFLLKIYDIATEKLIFSYGYSDLFIEWQTIAEAKSITKTYHECVTFPAPIAPVRLEINKRNDSLVFKKIFETIIDPKSIYIQREEPPVTENKKLNDAGIPSNCIDIVFISEGYTQLQKEKFFEAADKFRNYLFSWEPYHSFINKFNITAVFVPSPDEGTDIPGDNIWKTTLLNTHFYTFGIDRYLTLPDLCEVYDWLAAYPADQVCVLVNTEKYGGGGVYNFYNIFAAGNPKDEFLLLHEFGHGFACLGDEYNDSKVAYEYFGNKNMEPFWPNITTLVDFKSKWADMLNDTVPVPTPNSTAYGDVVGVFEGANYVSKGFYRPMQDCAMRSFKNKRFCPVCVRSIQRMIQFRTDK